MKDIINIFIIILFVTFFVGCNSISQNPIKGAEDLTKQLIDCQQTGDTNKAHKILFTYWTTYNGKEKKKFLKALNNNLIDHDAVVTFLLQPSFITYPMFETYLKNIFNIELELGQKTPGINAASKGLLLGSLLTDYDKRDETEKAYSVLSTMTTKLKELSELERLEFFYAFQYYIKECGEDGKRAHKMILKTKVTDFMLLAVEYTIDFEEQ